MPRPKADPRQKLEAADVYRLVGSKPSVIHVRLIEKFGEEQAVSLRTVSSWIAEFKAKLSDLDESFAWHRMPEYQEKGWSLPWEASEFLLRMWRRIWDGDRWEELGHPSVREAVWWWRVHLAAPDLELRKVEIWARRFALRELSQILFGDPSDVEDIYQALAYRDWESDDQRKIYERAISAGRIKQYVEQLHAKALASEEES